MSLFDGRAVEAALRAVFPHDYDGWSTVDCKAWHADYRVALNAALAALPREELVEKAADMLFWAAPWEIPGYQPPATPEGARSLAEALLQAIGLIPEHVTPEEEK